MFVEENAWPMHQIAIADEAIAVTAPSVDADEKSSFAPLRKEWLSKPPVALLVWCVLCAAATLFVMRALIPA